jgi:dihydrofolate reductase
VAALKQTDGGPIAVHGSAALGQSLADAGLVDGYHLLVFPDLLGAGQGLWSVTDTDATQLLWSSMTRMPTTSRSCSTSSTERSLNDADDATVLRRPGREEGSSAR